MAPTIPKEHKAAVCEGPNKGLVTKTAPTPQPAEDQVLIKVSASSICYSDHLPISGAYPGVPYPMVPGHEVVGRIVAKGDRVHEQYGVGEYVGLGWNGGYCQQCDACRRGEFYACDTHTVTGVTAKSGGGHQEYVAAHWSAVVKLPEDTGLSHAEIAPLLCAGLTVSDALNYGDTKPGDPVIIQGIGGLGHLGIQIARKMGRRVIAVSRGDSKRELALKLGAHEYYSSETAEQITKKYGGAKLAIATAPSTDSINGLLPLLGRNGQLVIVAVPTDGKPIEANAFALIPPRRSIHGLTCGTSINNEDFVKFAALGDNKVRSHINKWSLDQANEAYEQVVEGGVHGRNVFVFEE